MLTGLSLQDLPDRFPGVIIKNSKGYKEVGFRTRPPNGGFLISELARLPAELVGNLTELVRLPAKLVWWFKPRRGVISSKGRSPCMERTILQALKGRDRYETKSLEQNFGKKHAKHSFLS